MGKIKDIQIVLENNSKLVYQPGDVVSGVVILNVVNPVKVKVVTAKFHGFCKTKWVVEHSNSSDTVYKAKEEYISEEVILWTQESDSSFELIPGSHQKPIQFTLPRNCPSTFDSKYGKISYSITVNCVFPGISLDKEFVRPIVVCDVVDLNQDSSAAELLCLPIQLKGEEKRTCCGCYPSSTTADLTLDKSAYAPGDVIILNGHIENGNSDDLEMSFILCRRVTCYARKIGIFSSSSQFKAKEKKTEVCNWKSAKVPARTTKAFRNEACLTIPRDLVPSGMRHCNLIDVEYTLKVSLPVDAWFTVFLSFPSQKIVIGYRSSHLEQLPANTFGSLPTNTFGSLPTAPPESVAPASAFVYSQPESFQSKYSQPQNFASLPPSYTQATSSNFNRF